MTHAGKTSYHRSQLNADDFKLVKRGSGVVRGKFDTSIVLHCGFNTAVARRQIAITRRAGKDLAPDVGTKAGIPEDTMRRLLGMFGLAKGEGRAKQALNMAGRQVKA